ncbi:MAG TPA: excinuclease ABC subunit UvrA [Verrucomicrobiae bacterium]|jgi:excinuclease ABC subunit A|nr:excinuclease ABC subunit UvrA [Verrucomicrobiae bacterium]
MAQKIVIRGARQHNLKNIDLEIPRDRFVVITGVSGSGKSSLAFNTIYAESQRRYVESLSAYARQFLERMERPDVDAIEGLSPAIAIEQKGASRSPRSTVGTLTEIYDFLRLLFARVGKPHCWECGAEITAVTTEEIVDRLMALQAQSQVQILAPVAVDSKDLRAELDRLARAGFARVRIDGEMHELADEPALKIGGSTIDLVVDRLALRPGIEKRLADSLEIASRYGKEIVKAAAVLPGGESEELLFSRKSICLKCGVSYPEITPRFFSFNSPEGACPSCGGLGRVVEKGKKQDEEDDGEATDAAPCADCGGARLRKEALHVLIIDKNIADISAMPISEALAFLTGIRLPPRESAIAGRILREITDRLKFLIRVGVDYLSLDRSAATLSGGESQRVRLATEIGSGLVGVLYILDEPSVGLHPRDNERLLTLLRELKEAGNSVLVVEHDRDAILAAEYVIDMGPGAGTAGGEIIAHGQPDEIIANEKSLTGGYLSGRLHMPIAEHRRKGSGRMLSIRGARANNLKAIDVDIPLGTMTCVTGVSGSGKSSLVIDTFYRALARRLHGAEAKPGAYEELKGEEYFDAVVSIDQNPIGRTPRSNPATYTDLLPHIRDLFAQLPEARMRGFRPSRFSFNAKGGSCEACQGEGMVRIEMHFLPDVYVPCAICRGRRYNRETLEILYKGRNIADVLDLTVNEAIEFLGNFPAIRRKLETLRDVGMGYVRLGQSATTLSGGEAQRIKLARELSKRSTGRTLYILDEPTTGLHFDDIRKLLDVLNRLADAGNTLLVIEHNLDMIKAADFIVDLGPEGGMGGGQIVACGTPEEVAAVEDSYTGRYLKSALRPG